MSLYCFFGRVAHLKSFNVSLFVFLHSSSFLRSTCICEQFSCQFSRSAIAHYGNLKRLYLLIQISSEKMMKKKIFPFDLGSLQLKYMSKTCPVYVRVYLVFFWQSEQSWCNNKLLKFELKLKLPFLLVGLGSETFAYCDAISSDETFF